MFPHDFKCTLIFTAWLIWPQWKTSTTWCWVELSRGGPSEMIKCLISVGWKLTLQRDFRKYTDASVLKCMIVEETMQIMLKSTQNKAQSQQFYPDVWSVQFYSARAWLCRELPRLWSMFVWLLKVLLSDLLSDQTNVCQGFLPRWTAQSSMTPLRSLISSKQCPTGSCKDNFRVSSLTSLHPRCAHRYWWKICTCMGVYTTCKDLWP